MGGIAIVCQVSRGQAVWHISLPQRDPGTGQVDGPTLCGAWVLGADADTSVLNAGKIVLTGPAAVVALTDLADEIATVERDLQHAFETAPRKKGQKLVDPRWRRALSYDPVLPARFDSPREVFEPLSLAHWATSLLEVWVHNEGQRVSKPVLADFGGLEPRQLPPRWSQDYAVAVDPAA